MKKLVLSLMMLAAWMGASAMSFERAQAEALYLTDKMAYELNLNDQQYNDAYEINLDYFLRIDSPSDLYGSYYTYRLYDLRCILHDWQYSILTAADYFLRPILWRAGGWYFPIYSYYNRGYYYYSRPTVWVSYYGGHGRSYYRDGFYSNRRPHWNGGLRGHDMYRPSVGHGGGHDGRRISGNGYHIDLNGRRSGGGSSHGSGHGGYGNGDGGRGSGYGNGNRGGGSNYGSRDNHGGSGSSHDGGMNPGGSSHGNMGSGSGGRSSGNVISRGNSFDGSSSRMSGSRVGSSSYGSSSRSSYSSTPSSRGSISGSRSNVSSSHSGSMSVSRGSSMGVTRSSSSSYGGGSRGGSSISGGSRGGGFSGGSRGGGMSRGGGGSSRGGRR